MLAIDRGLLLFTSGAGVRIGSAAVPASATLGRTVRVVLDPVTRAASSITIVRGVAATGEVDAAHIPGDYLIGSSAQAAGAGGENAKTVDIIVNVTVPASTPLADDVYYTTERTSFSAAENKMTRVDSQHWTIKLSYTAGSTVHYRFTRGSNATVERSAAGIIPDPRALTATEGLQTRDIVPRWADTP